MSYEIIELHGSLKLVYSKYKILVISTPTKETNTEPTYLLRLCNISCKPEWSMHGYWHILNQVLVFKNCQVSLKIRLKEFRNHIAVAQSSKLCVSYDSDNNLLNCAILFPNSIIPIKIAEHNNNGYSVNMKINKNLNNYKECPYRIESLIIKTNKEDILRCAIYDVPYDIPNPINQNSIQNINIRTLPPTPIITPAKPFPALTTNNIQEPIQTIFVYYGDLTIPKAVLKDCKISITDITSRQPIDIYVIKNTATGKIYLSITQLERLHSKGIYPSAKFEFADKKDYRYMNDSPLLFNQDSKLKLYGYTVGITYGKPANIRRQILKYVISNEIMTPKEIIPHLQGNIARFAAQTRDYSTAIEEWKEDIEYVSRYAIRKAMPI